ncbi:unnamed protein product [Pipistrellus nathusii]|uniref:Ribosomal protein L20 n=1 Tax=Pipistrellus nathusii TaxID=59473 RepID=A0ABP0AED0_PIPNA
MDKLTRNKKRRPTGIKHRQVVGKLISQRSQIATGQRLKFLLRATFFKLKLLLTPLLQNRLAQAMVFCGRATLKGLKSRMWLESRSLLTMGIDHNGFWFGMGRMPSGY